MSPIIHTPTWHDEDELMPDEVVALLDAYMSTERGTVPAIIATNCTEGLRRIHKRGLIRRVKVKKSIYAEIGYLEYHELTRSGHMAAGMVLSSYRFMVKLPSKAM